ncbi:MAG: class I SAM-dependent methyltransferase [Clostridiales bacterium]|jgi:ubiquinone/menaquinone biosynthesis C-methylase UbiE|nr:class I SAM-dependent methyltransferase [Clostridiales bacterium]
MTFWDFCAPVYDFFERRNDAYAKMLAIVDRLIPADAAVLDAATGTGSVGLAAAANAKSVLCTDLSARMLKKAKKKAAGRGVRNVEFAQKDIFDLGGGIYDVVIASQVLHLLDDPAGAAAELRRVAADAENSGQVFCVLG